MYFRTAILAAVAFSTASSAFGMTTLYSAQLNEINGSGAYGQVFMIVSDDTLYVNLGLNGFESDKNHPIQIHASFMNNLENPPVQDINHDGIIDRYESAQVIGDTVLSLVSASQASPGYNTDPLAYIQAPTDGYFEFSQTYTFDLTNPAQALAWQDIQNLEMRTIEIQGMTLNGTYQYDIPVAIGLITPGVYEPPTPPAPVPEPSSLALLGVSISGLLLRKKRGKTGTHVRDSSR